MFVIETPCESFVVLAADADAIKLPLTTPISVNLILAELLNVFKVSILVCCEADDRFKLVTEVFKLAVVKFKFVILTPCESFVVLAADADDINEPLTTPISVNLVLAEPLNVFKPSILVC